MTRYVHEQLNDVLRQAIGSFDPAIPPRTLRWEVPKDASFGDLSSPIAFKLASRPAQKIEGQAGSQRQPPQQLAERLVAVLQDLFRASPLAGLVERVDAKSGFVNLGLSWQALTQILRQIHRMQGRYGTSRLGQGQPVLMEFLSANPTGPLSVAHGRQAAVGDALARLLRSQGYRVRAEYYLNDEGRQIELLGRSLRARSLEQLGPPEPFPEDGYHGVYVVEHATRLIHTHRDGLRDHPLAWFCEQGMQEQLATIKEDLARFGLTFDRWSSQRWLRTSGRIDAVLKQLQAAGLLYESEGATWFASTKFGDDKDRVVRKQDGELTYLAPDIAYHHWKFQRGYAQLINLWGPDHHGYIARLKAAVTALGLPADRLVIRIVQLVTLLRHGTPVPMSKRQGEFVTFREILDEVGVDATRFFYLMRTMDSHLDFDLDLAKSQSSENPVYYVQYAHARIWSVLAYARRQMPWSFHLSARLWRAIGHLGQRQVGGWGRVQLGRLVEPEERMLLRQLFQFPMVLAACAHTLEPHGLTTYLQRLAELFHIFYDRHRVISDDLERSRARLALIEAARVVLANGLGLLGVSAPRRM